MDGASLADRRPGAEERFHAERRRVDRTEPKRVALGRSLLRTIRGHVLGGQLEARDRIGLGQLELGSVRGDDHGLIDGKPERHRGRGIRAELKLERLLAGSLDRAKPVG